jgi:hypothetical protein
MLSNSNIYNNQPTTSKDNNNDENSSLSRINNMDIIKQFNVQQHQFNNQQTVTSQQLQNVNYLTIVQDPYPPLNNSPELYDSNRLDSHMSSFINCIDMCEFQNETFQNEDTEIKKEQDLFS